MEEEKCFKVKSVTNSMPFGGDIIIIYDKNKSIIDFNPFFEDFFLERTCFFNDDFYRESRKNLGKGRKRYKFSMVEFAECFFGKFTPDKIGNFLESKLIQDKNSEEFLKLIRTFEQKYKLILPVSDGWGQDYQFFYPINCSKKEIDNLLKLNLQREEIPREYCKSRMVGWGTREDINEKEESKYSITIRSRKKGKNINKKLRIAFLEKSPLVTICPNHGRIYDLDNYLEMIKAYDLPTDHLEIKRKSTQ